MKRILMLLAVAGCSHNYSAPPEPSKAPAPAVDEAALYGDWMMSLGASDSDARTYAIDEFRKAGLDAGPWLFAGGTDPNSQRAAACRQILDEFRQEEWRAAPPIGEEFGRTLLRSLAPGQPLRVHAWWWLALACRSDDARRLMPDPSLALTDEDTDVRRYSAIVYVRIGNDVRKLPAYLEEVLTGELRAPGTFKDWKSVDASLAAAGFGEEELLETRVKLRKLLLQVRNDGDETAWWTIREFFRRLGPGTEPLLVSCLLYEPEGDLRRMAAISYAGRGQVKDELERARAAKPNDDLAVALGNAGSAKGLKDLVALLEKSAPGSRDRWAASLALERGTGKWFGNAAAGEDAVESALRWRALADNAGPNTRVAFSCDDGGAMLWRGPANLSWQIGCGPLSKDGSLKNGPAWAVFAAPAWDESCADTDLLLAWRLYGARFVQQSAVPDEQAARLIARAAATAAGGRPEMIDLTAATAAVRTRHSGTLPANRSTLSDSRATENARAAALRCLSTGTDEDAAAIAAFLDTKPSVLLRRAAYLSLFQLDSETSLLALAGHAGDSETKIAVGETEDSAAVLLLRVRFAALGADRLAEAGTDAGKWEALVHEALKK
ncbi:MAG: hypothetical protein K8T20_03690 [Planctomycetes bacterium]|nr:hypothetical protein [Planctomycetota bacterium]